MTFGRIRSMNVCNDNPMKNATFPVAQMIVKLLTQTFLPNKFPLLVFSMLKMENSRQNSDNALSLHLTTVSL